MSLSRAFTTRRLRGNSDVVDRVKLPQRSNTSKAPRDIRNKISAPVQLLHTTNMLSYNAPDLPRPARSNSTNSSKTSLEAESQSNTDSTPPSSPDASTAEPNHLSCYFKMSVSPLMTASSAEAQAPAIPRRSPSHTKQNSYDAMARQRSVSRASRDSDYSSSARGGQTYSRSTSSTSTRASSASHASPPFSQKLASTASPPPAVASIAFSQTQAKETHPFGHELAQVTELAEEYCSNSGGLDTIDEEEQFIRSRGFQKVSPDDYLSAIQSISAMFFPERKHTVPSAPLWI